MKKLNIVFLIILLLSLTSCMSQNTEIKYRLIISGIGVDYDKENNEYELTVQVLDTSENSAEQGKSSVPVSNYTAKGKTITEAINSLGENTGKTPLYSQNRMIILGESVTGEQMIKALNFFVREYTSRPDVFVAAAKGKASDVLTIKANGEVPAKLIESAIEQSYKNSVSANTELYNTVNLSLEESSCFTLPLIEISKDRNKDEKTIRISGTRACSKDVSPKILSTEETMAFQFIMNDIQSGSLSLVCDDIPVGLEIISSKSKTDLKIIDGKPVFNIQVKSEFDIVEYEKDVFKNFSEKDVKKIQQAAEKHISTIINNLLERMLKKEGCDIFRFGKRLEQKYPDIYKNFSSDLKKSLSETGVNVSVKVKIGRIGQMTIEE